MSNKGTIRNNSIVALFSLDTSTFQNRSNKSNKKSYKTLLRVFTCVLLVYICIILLFLYFYYIYCCFCCSYNILLIYVRKTGQQKRATITEQCSVLLLLLTFSVISLQIDYRVIFGKISLRYERHDQANLILAHCKSWFIPLRPIKTFETEMFTTFVKT